MKERQYASAEMRMLKRVKELETALEDVQKLLLKQSKTILEQGQRLAALERHVLPVGSSPPHVERPPVDFGWNSNAIDNLFKGFFDPPEKKDGQG